MFVVDGPAPVTRMGRFAFGRRRPNKGWMHLNNGGINRPSLLSGGAQTKNAAPATGRILADMEGRPVAGAARAAASAGTRSRRWLWLALLATAVVVLGAFAAWRFAGSGGDEPMGYSLPPEANITPSPLPAAMAAPGGATIVDAAAGADGNAPAADPLAAIGNAADAADPAPAGHPAAATVGAATASAAAAATATAVRRPAAGTAVARTGRDKAKGDENLLGTLMGIIKEDDKPKPKAKAAPDSMDALIAQIQAEERKQAADTDNVFDNISGKNATASTKSNIQAKLRNCGSATSATGLSCRKKICAAVAGKDPACPAM
ncbi:hypothetical protein KQ945_11685 [Bacillus subtilis subsp. subtilis]|nr:hypothetical protein [Bacillus subtilis subsp. subtilis]